MFEYFQSVFGENFFEYFQSVFGEKMIEYFQSIFGEKMFEYFQSIPLIRMDPTFTAPMTATASISTFPALGRAAT